MTGDRGATLVLTRAEIAGLVTPGDYRRAVEAGFRASEHGAVPAPMHIAGAGAGFHVKGAGFPEGALGGDGGAYVAFKVNGNFPRNRAERGLPTIQGAIVLCDGVDGSVLAVMDSIEVTLQRTAAASALAAVYLARPESATITICGCGDQALPHLRALQDVRPLVGGFAWDRDPDRARTLAVAAGRIGLRLEVVADFAEGARQSDVIVTCTTATTPFLGPRHVRPGAFIAAVGADSPDKSELEPALFAGATIVADVLSQCLAMGDLRHAVAAGMLAPDGVHAELADLVVGRKAGRRSDDEVIIFDSTGTAIEDVASAAMIFQLAKARGLGVATPLGAPAARSPEIAS
jgi:alanine dehydrogenase